PTTTISLLSLHDALPIWSNTYALFTNGWRGVGVESDSRRFTKLARAYRHYPRVFACRNLVTPHNVVALLQSYEIAKDFEVLSIRSEEHTSELQSLAYLVC